MGNVDRRSLTLQSLAGLSVGDAFGEQFFIVPQEMLVKRELPSGPWRWTDDTHMALSITDVLFRCGAIDQDMLADAFAQRFLQEPWRGYAGGARRLLALYTHGADWRIEAPRLFDGGSYGNGGAMRAAPIGAFYAGDPERAATDARRSAAVTHAHPEGQAGAMAVAAAAAIIGAEPSERSAILQLIQPYLPASRTRDGIEEAVRIGAEEQSRAVAVLGTGNQVAAFDTVPYCLWVVAHHSAEFAGALWTTVSGLGDRDTTSAIVGGIVSLACEIPQEWLRRREPLAPEFEI